MAQAAPKLDSAPTTSIWEWAASSIAGTYSDPAIAAQKLRDAAKYCRLIGGAAITPFVDGHEVMITVIPIDRADTYPISQSKKEQEAGAPKRRGIGKATLMTIANAAGVEWLTTEREDDGSDPHFAEYHVSGRYRAIDGQFRPVLGDKDNDLRSGSDQIANKSEFEVTQLRATMKRSAITKAKLRALREAFGVPHGVLESEIDKPFVFAKTIFTGRSNDPAARRMYSQVIAMQQLAATAAMYGGSMPNMQLPAMAEPSRQLPERTVVTADGEVIDSPAPARAAPPPPPMAPPPARPAATAPKANGGTAKPGEPVVEWGNKKGVPLRELSDRDLDWYIESAQKSIDDPEKAQFRSKEEKRLAQYLAEAKRRDDLAAGSPPDDRGPDDDLPT